MAVETEVQQLIGRFLNTIRVLNAASPNTIKAYTSDLSFFEEFFTKIYPKPVLALTKMDLEAFIAWRIKGQSETEHLDEFTQARQISCLRSFYKYLVREELVPDNVAKRLDLPRVNRKLPSVLNLEEIELMIEHTPDLRDKALIETLYSAGLRVSEATNLQLKSINWAEEYLVVTGKGDKTRFAPIGTPALKALQNYLQDPQRPLPQKGHESYIFLNKRGGQLSRVSVWNIIQEAAIQAGINKQVSPHTFRHSFATHLLEAGADIVTVRDLLGHSSVTTSEIYVHLSMNQIRDTVTRYHPRK